jgi:nucleoside-diphosphate-sugar epimerase
MLNFENKFYLEDIERTIKYVKSDIYDCSILITGATGLIGSFLTDTLIYFNRHNLNKIHIYCMSRSIQKLKQRFSYICTEDMVHFIEQDVCKPIIDDIHFDYIIHAASNSDPTSFSLYPVETISANVIGTINILEYAKKNKATRILYASSREAYGYISNNSNYNEEEYGVIDFNKIRSCYPESKRVSELLCRSYVSEYDVNAVIARFGYIYGPTMLDNDSKAVAQFLRKSLEGEDIILKSTGEQERTYCYVSDAVSGLLCLLFKGNTGEAYNISNSQSIISIRGIAKLLCELTGKKLRMELPNDIERKGYSNPQNAIISDSKLIGLGWLPEIDIKEGLQRTLKILQY